MKKENIKRAIEVAERIEKIESILIDLSKAKRYQTTELDFSDAENYYQLSIDISEVFTAEEILNKYYLLIQSELTELKTELETL